jgi:hypothetical protein
MRLITEHNDNIQIITEDNSNGSKDYYIEGIFMQSDTKNRNGRMYPTKILDNEVKRYNKEYVNSGRAMGELGHPEGPALNLERVSHLIKELNTNGKDITGKAKVMDTPYGKIVKNLIDEGVKLGVSSRGMGSIKADKEGTNIVQEDFMLAAVDIVADPSAPDAFVEGIMEGVEWIWENGILNQRTLENCKCRISRASRRELEEIKLEEFENFLRRL